MLDSHVTYMTNMFTNALDAKHPENKPQLECTEPLTEGHLPMLKYGRVIIIFIAFKKSFSSG